MMMTTTTMMMIYRCNSWAQKYSWSLYCRTKYFHYFLQMLTERLSYCLRSSWTNVLPNWQNAWCDYIYIFPRKYQRAQHHVFCIIYKRSYIRLINYAILFPKNPSRYNNWSTHFHSWSRGARLHICFSWQQTANANDDRDKNLHAVA